METRGRRRLFATIGSALFFVAAPGFAAGLMPWWLTGWRLEDPLPYWLPVRVLGALLLIAAVAALVQAFGRFALEGLGTPAPIAPTEKLVVGGWYRYVRNPMYLAVVGSVVAQGLVLGQPVLFLYAGGLWLLFAAFVRWYEEPTLSAQFGDQYERYRLAVPAWLPRRRAWRPVDLA
jgi:protein-S-isoprenylcysteine O-methyltransferase Ste14